MNTAFMARTGKVRSIYGVYIAFSFFIVSTLHLYVAVYSRNGPLTVC